MGTERVSGPMKILVFKPDGVGDFVLAAGAIHLLANEFGEDNLTIAVLPSAAPLAADQFPGARIISLPLTSKRKVLNLFLANFLQIFPVWLALMPEKFDIVLSLRHSRKFLHSFFLAALRSRMRLVSENQLSLAGHPARGAVEKTLWRLRNTTVLPYPERSDAPRELEMHRRLLEKIFCRPLETIEIAPLLRSPREVPSSQQGPVLLCPFSSMKSKDYPSGSWVDVFSLFPQSMREIAIELAGDACQRRDLDILAAELQKTGYSKAKVREPESLVDFTRAVYQARLVLTVDTAAAHFACALNRPTIVLFSGLHRGDYAPWTTSERQIWLEPAPPSPEETPRKKSHWHRGIPPARVAATLLRLLEPIGPETPPPRE
jgi:ADP-heptose:LPS heptosyltransferase